MTKKEYQETFRNIAYSSKNKCDMFVNFDALTQKMYKEDWFLEEMKEAFLKDIDKFVDVKDLALGDKNLFIE